MSQFIKESYEIAKAKYAEFNVDTEKVISILRNKSISLNCWQGDDVCGFEKPVSQLSGGGIQVTGNYLGKPRNIDEFRMDLKMAYSLIPGRHRLNLHSTYGEFGDKIIERNKFEPKHYRGWVDWVKQENLKLDFNSTCFSHPKADTGFTLASKNHEIRNFWIEHVKRTREIAAFIGRELNSPCIHNHWIPDGFKDLPYDRWTHRKLLKESLDEIFQTKYDKSYLKDSLESKLFGIGSESYTVGSHEFYLGYAFKNDMMLCLDMGHFHPTESISDKISALLQFTDEILIHLSRGIRWDSDHVVILNDEIKSLMSEIVRGDVLDNIHLALDFFDASINRIGAWVLGSRATLKGLMLALLEPGQMLKEYENKGDYFARLALFEELKVLPFGAVWDYYCLTEEVPVGNQLIKEIHKYENSVLRKR